MRVLLTAAVAIVTCAQLAQASHIQTTTLGSGRTASIRTDAATPLKDGEWSAGMNFEYADSDQLSESQLLELRAADHEASLHSIESIRTLNLELSYGLTADLTIGLHIPYVVRDNIIEAGHHEEEELELAMAPRALVLQPLAEQHLDGIEALGKSAGLGDISVYGLWRIYQNRDNDTNIGLLGGVRVPTGADDKVADTGERFEAEFQPGSGSWDPFAGAAWGRRVGPFDLAASTLYTLATEGSQDTDLGDQWTYNAAAGYQLGSVDGTDWSLVLELNGGWRDREEVAGLTDANSGGSWLFISPGVSISGPRWSVYASFGYPIDDELHGDQDDLGSRVLVGVQFLR